MFGIDSLAGHIVWSKFFPGSSCDASGKPRLLLQLLDDYAGRGAPALLVTVRRDFI